AAIDSNAISRPGPRIVEGLELLAGLLHPDRFRGGTLCSAPPPCPSPLRGGGMGGGAYPGRTSAC
ncbi:MAG: hypothetical protein WBH61_04865, partial [Candidatus Methylomirabilis sp.]